MQNEKFLMGSAVKKIILIVIILIIMGIFLTACNDTTESEDTVKQIVAASTDAHQETEIPMVRNIDFDTLEKINDDVIGWLYIPGTIIDYPIAQTFNNDYYLDNNFEKEPDELGAIYLDHATGSDFSDKNTVVYGHNNDNGTMFAQLHKFENESFFNENSTIYIITENGQFEYKIFAAYERDDTRILWNVDFNDAEFFENYINDIKQRDGKKDNQRDLEISADDKIISLSTCIKNQPNKRYIVVGVLLD